MLASEERKSFFVVYAEAPSLRTWRLAAWRIVAVVVTQMLARRHLLSLVGNAHVLVIMITTTETSRAINNSISSQYDRGIFNCWHFRLDPKGRYNCFGRLKRVLLLLIAAWQELAREPFHDLLLYDRVVVVCLPLLLRLLMVLG